MWNSQKSQNCRKFGDVAHKMLAAAFGKYREVRIEQGRGQPSCMSEFEEVVANLKPNERIVLDGHFRVRILVALLTHPRAAMIRALVWEHGHDEDPTCIIPLLGNMLLLKVDFGFYDEIDFLTRALEHHRYIKAVVMPDRMLDGCMEFFQAVGVVKMLSIDPCVPGLARYMAKNDLQMLELTPDTYEGVKMPHSVNVAIRKCTKLTELHLHRLDFGERDDLVLPAVTGLVLCNCAFQGAVNWTRRVDLNWTIPNLTTLYLSKTRFLPVALGDFLLGHPTLNSLIVNDAADVARHMPWMSYWYPPTWDMLLGELGSRVLSQIRELTFVGKWEDIDRQVLQNALGRPDSKVRKLTVVLFPHAGLEELRIALQHSLVETLSFRFTSDVTILFANWYNRRSGMLALMLARRRGNPMHRLPIELYRMVGGMVL